MPYSLNATIKPTQERVTYTLETDGNAGIPDKLLFVLDPPHWLGRYDWTRDAYHHLRIEEVREIFETTPVAKREYNHGNYRYTRTHGKVKREYLADALVMDLWDVLINEVNPRTIFEPRAFVKLLPRLVASAAAIAAQNIRVEVCDQPGCDGETCNCTDGLVIN